MRQERDWVWEERQARERAEMEEEQRQEREELEEWERQPHHHQEVSGTNYHHGDEGHMQTYNHHHHEEQETEVPTQEILDDGVDWEEYEPPDYVYELGERVNEERRQQWRYKMAMQNLLRMEQEDAGTSSW